MVGTLKKPSCEVSNSSSSTIKFLYSYGGKILPRYPDGKLRYVDGETRVLSVDRASISYSELMVKLCELCGLSVSLRCQLPSEDLDALVSIKSDEDLINVMEEYDLASKEKSPFKIKAFLFPLKSIKKISPPVSAVSSPVAGRYSPPSSTTSPVSGFANNQSVNVVRFVNPHHHQHLHNQISSSSPMGFQATPNFHPQQPPHRYYYSCIPPHQGSPRQVYLVHNGNHWQIVKP